VEETQNPGLRTALEESEGVARLVEVNYEPNWFKWWILRVFGYRIRGERKKEQWGRYFFVRRGLDEDVREAIGALNTRVGYVYLLDRECKIRWAGSAKAMDDEKESLAKGVRRLVAEAKGVKSQKTERADSVVG